MARCMLDMVPASMCPRRFEQRVVRRDDLLERSLDRELAQPALDCFGVDATRQASEGVAHHWPAPTQLRIGLHAQDRQGHVYRNEPRLAADDGRHVERQPPQDYQWRPDQYSPQRDGVPAVSETLSRVPRAYDRQQVRQQRQQRDGGLKQEPRGVPEDAVSRETRDARAVDRNTPGPHVAGESFPVRLNAWGHDMPRE